MSKNCIYALKGHIIFTESNKHFTAFEGGYIISKDGIVVDVFKELPESYSNIDVIDYGDKIIIPGMADLHIHAPQFPYRGLGMDLELMPWLDTYAFREEAKYANEEYAYAAYERFCTALKRSVTSHASIFATLHVNATCILMDKLEEAGLNACVGKVNMDRNSPDYLIQPTQESIDDTFEWVKKTTDRYQNIKPIITPRFIPTCTDKLLSALGRIAAEYNTPVQSHLSEAKGEIAFVKSLFSDFRHQGKIYDKYGLFGTTSTIMAHCVYPSDEELDLIQKNGVYIAHCPQANMNIVAGIAPIRKMLDRGIHIGLGSDIAGGFSVSILRAISDAIQVSKLYSIVIDEKCTPLTLPEVFYMATKGGGSFFGKTGSFEPGYGMNAVVIDDEYFNQGYNFSIEQRLERIVYLSSDRDIFAKYVNGKKIY
jgi:guanine deaminase